MGIMNCTLAKIMDFSREPPQKRNDLLPAFFIFERLFQVQNYF